MSPAGARETGFTLLEGVVSLLIIVLVVAIASPRIQDYRRSSRLSAIASDFAASVQLARSEAVKRGKVVSMCPTQRVTARSPTCSDDPNFAAWIVFEDGDGDCLPVAGAVPIQVEAAIRSDESGHISARGSGVCISFSSAGALRSVQDMRTADRLLVCDSRGIGVPETSGPSPARGVFIDRNGRVSMTRERDTIRTWRVSCPAGSH
jgi:type IV fimbrial biogenesis protein FimT